MLLPRDRENQALINLYGVCDNQLEHLVIVPLQAKLGHSITEKWTVRLRKEWEGKFWEGIQTDFDRRASVLMSFLSIAIIVDENDLTKLAKAELHKMGLLHDAEKFLDKVLRVIDDKPRLSAAAMRFLGLPRDECYLIYLDVQNDKEVPVDIPPH